MRTQIITWLGKGMTDGEIAAKVGCHRTHVGRVRRSIDKADDGMVRHAEAQVHYELGRPFSIEATYFGFDNGHKFLDRLESACAAFRKALSPYVEF